MKHIPNILTAFRIVLVGVFCWLFLTAKNSSQYLWSMIVYIAAFLTDLLDGYLARKHNWISNFGKLFDPFADKLMLIAVLICFYIGNGTKHYIDLYILILAAVKELLMIAGGAVFLLKKLVVYADWWGKIAMGAFMASIIFTFIDIIWGVCGFLYPWDYIISIALAFVSMFHYGIKNLRISKQKQDKQNKQA